MQLLYQAFGISFAVQFTPKRLASRIRRAVPHGLQPVERVDASAHLFTLSSKQSGCHLRAPYLDRDGVDLETALRLLEEEMYRVLMVSSPSHVMVHAGVVGWRGRAVAFPGVSCSGKTTLTRALLERGAELYSDDLLVLDVDGRVHPYPRPLLLRDEARHVDAETFGAPVADRPAALGAVLLTSYRPAAVWRPRVVSEGVGLAALLEHTPSVSLDPARVMSHLRLASRHATFVRSSRGEAARVADWLVERFTAWPPG